MNVSAYDQAARPWQLYSARERTVFLVVLFLVGMSSYVDRHVLSVLLEPIKAEFGVSDSVLGLLSGLSFALFYATLGLPIARLADRGDRRLIITLSLVVWSLFTALCGFAQNIWQLAAARVGVGAGEAGAVPPAQSLIADYYAPDRRGRALSIFIVSSAAGLIVGQAAGGWIAEHHGWRAAFIAAGLPGLLLALLSRTVLKEPRHQPRFAVDRATQEPVRATLRTLSAKRSYRGIVGAMVLYYAISNGAFVFHASFLIRVHELTIGDAGALLGSITAVGTVIGSIAGGALADRLARRDVAWFARLPGLGLIATVPLFQLMYFTSGLRLFSALVLVTSLMIAAVVPAIFAALHVVCGSARRAMAVAILFFAANLIGLGLGPVVAGGLSDALAANYGPAQGLRYALMVVVLVFLPTGWLLLRAARNLAADAED